MKVLVVFGLILALSNCAKLLKKPKVYNALITTDEDLTPSRAFPLIQPIVQPAIPVLTPFYHVNEHGSFSHNSNDINNEARQASENETSIGRKSDERIEISPDDNEPPQEFEQNTAKPSPMKPNGSPIPLNEYGFPPSLIPLQKYETYPYTYPLVFDSYGNIQTVQQYPVIPPNFYPQQEGQQLLPLEQPLFTVTSRKLEQASRILKQVPENKNTFSTNDDPIKNYSNKNSAIPDADIPPIPFTIKKS